MTSKGRNNDYLSLQTEDQVLEQLIDMYRWRVQNDHARNIQNHGIYYEGQKKPGTGQVWAEGDAIDDFQRFVDFAENAKVLPEWWRFEHRMQCLLLALDAEGGHCILEPIGTVHDGGLNAADEADRKVAERLLAELVVGFDSNGARMPEDWYESFRLELQRQVEAILQKSTGTAERIQDILDEAVRNMNIAESAHWQ